MTAILLAAVIGASLCVRDSYGLRCEGTRDGLVYVDYYRDGQLVSSSWGTGGGTAIGDNYLTPSTDAEQQPVDCSLLTPQQAQGLTCLTPQAPTPPPPAFDQPPTTPEGIPIPPPNPNGFKVGRTYRRDATGTRLFIVSLGQDVRGFYVYTGQCLDVQTEDHCYSLGFPVLIWAHYGTLGWTDITGQ